MRIKIPGHDVTVDLWKRLLKIAPTFPGEWTVVGAQMVALHGLERDLNPPRASDDVDVVVNVRTVGTSTEEFARVLESHGLVLESPNADGVGHRFSDESMSVDLLAPDGLRSRKPPITIPPARTVLVPGGTQALNRSEVIPVIAGDVEGEVRRPNLTGAILVKARAVEVDDVPQSQLEDLAFLLSLVEDPEEVRGEMKKTERSWLRRRTELLDSDARAWQLLEPASAAAGHAALRIILDV